MRILIVEDDVVQRNNLIKIVEGRFKDVQALYSDSVKESLFLLKERKIDLFMLDIKLKDGSGIELAEKIRKIKGYELTGIIFLTTEKQLILDAFKKTHCYEFIVKPYESKDVVDIINIFNENKKMDNKKVDEFLLITLENKVKYKLRIKDIIFIEYLSRRCVIHTTKGVLTTREYTLNKISTLINCENIVQTHKSFLVNCTYIQKIEKEYYKLWKIHFDRVDDTALLSINYKNNLMELLGDYNVD